jgi:hypothetical protein
MRVTKKDFDAAREKVLYRKNEGGPSFLSKLAQYSLLWPVPEGLYL